MNLSQKLPKECIMKKNDAFREVIEKGRVWRGKWITIFFMKSDKAAVGFSVPKKFGKAVARNRAKRLMREVYRKNRHVLSSHRMVWIPKEDGGTLKYRNLETDIQQYIKLLKKTDGR